MNKFIRNSILFLLFSGIFYMLCLLVWGSNFMLRSVKQSINSTLGGYGHMHTRLKEINTVNTTDILFLGSSHSYRGFDPRIFLKHGYHSFNLGSSAQTPIQTLSLLHAHLDRLKPKLIVFEVYPFTLESDGVESSLDLVSNNIDLSKNLNMISKVNHIKTYNTYIYSALRNLLKPTNLYSEPIQKGNDMYVSGGYVEKK